MANIERSGGENGYNIVEILAKVRLGQIKRDELGEENQATLGYYLGLMDDDPAFKARVVARENEITNIAKNGRKIPLFTKEELVKAKNHRKKRVHSVEKTFQLDMFEDPPKGGEIIGSGTILNSEKTLTMRHSNTQNPFEWHKDKLISKEMRQKRLELRDLIGLPEARGKDKHVNDDFYKILVKRVVIYDTFGIFGEFDRVLTETSPELNLKIEQVRGLMDELLNGRLNLRERFQKFNQFKEKYWDGWGGVYN